MAIREFNDVDWMGLAGAETFADGKQPLIEDGIHEMLLTADAAGIFIYPNNEDDEGPNGYILPIPLATQDLARCMLKGVVHQILDLMILKKNPFDWAKENGFEEC